MIDAPDRSRIEDDDSAPVAGHVESVPMDQADPALVGGSPGAVYARGSATWWAPQRSISRRRAPILRDVTHPPIILVQRPWVGVVAGAVVD